MDLINHDVENDLGVRVEYVLVHCTNPNCTNSWGIRIYNSYINKPIEPKTTDFICRACAMKEVAKRKMSSKNNRVE